VADPPSRGRWDEIDFLQPFDICFPCCPVTGKALRNLTAEANRGQSDLAKNLEAEDLVKAVYKKSNQAFLCKAKR